VIGFSDTGLAYLFLAASRVPQRSRARWLRRLARDLDPSSPTPNGQACRDARARQRNGISFFRIPVNRVDLEEMLIREGLIRAGVDHSHADVEAALQHFITTLISVSTDITVGQ
jgi:hypothetical protein